MERTRRQVGQIDVELLARVDAAAEALGQTRVVFVSRALERALQANGDPATRHEPATDPGSTPPRAVAPARKSAGKRRADLVGQERKAVSYPARVVVAPFPKGK